MATRRHLTGHSRDRSASDRADSIGEGKGVMSSLRVEGAVELEPEGEAEAPATAFLSASRSSASLVMTAGEIM